MRWWNGTGISPFWARGRGQGWQASNNRALAQYLITSCLPDRYERQFVCAPPQGQPETRALCFLTKVPVEMGFACSVCLTVFEHDNLGTCPVCGTRFAVMSAGGPRKRVKRAAAAGAATT